jgi:hypothetical protein
VNCTVFDYANCTGKAECTKAAHFAKFTAFMVPTKRGASSIRRRLISPISRFRFSIRAPNSIPLLPESQKLDQALKGSTLPHVFCYIDSDDKRVSHVHNVSYPGLPASKKVNSAMLAFMDQNA